MGFSKMKPPDNIMPYAMTIIYALIFKKNFKATVLPTNDPNEYLLFLYAANMKYYTAYRLLPGKIKWEKGVLPDRIIK